MSQSSPDTRPRVFLRLDVRDLPERRRSTEPLLGLVLRRGRGGVAAARMRPSKRSSASARFLCWLRWLEASSVITPALVMRWPAMRFNRVNMAGLIAGELAASNFNWTALLVVLTCCPPGPEARTAVKPSSWSSREIWGVTTIMAVFITEDLRLRK